MKKIMSAVLVAIVATSVNVVACGGMTQIDPPSLHLQQGPCDVAIEDALSDITQTLVIC